jgi:hypothetical protein
MCSEQVLVPIPEKIMPYIYEWDPNHSEYGVNENGEKCLRLDKCIVPLIQKLWDGDFNTTSCCCGHGSYGVVGLKIEDKEWALVEIEHPHCGVGWVEDQHEFHEWRTRNYPHIKEDKLSRSERSAIRILGSLGFDTLGNEELVKSITNMIMEQYD